MVANQPKACSDIHLDEYMAILSRLYGKSASYPSVASNHVSSIFWKRNPPLTGCAILEGLTLKTLIGVS